MIRGEKFNHDLESVPLEVKTDSLLGSDKKIRTTFFMENIYAGGFVIKLSSPPLYYLFWCIDSPPYIKIPTDLPTATQRVWRITVDKSSGVRLKIHCNEEEVINRLISDQTCDPKVSKKWSRDITKVEFESGDTASKFRRSYTGNFIESFCTLKLDQIIKCWLFNSVE